MKIIIVKPTGHIKMDSDVYCEGLEKRGHDIVRIIHNDKQIIVHGKLEGADLIWCPYEQELPVGEFLKQTLSIPLIGHFEWVPPWRVSPNQSEKWGYEGDEIEGVRKQQPKFYHYYNNLIEVYLKCDVKTTPTEYCFKTLCLDGETAKIKPYILDDELLLSQKDDSIKPERQILTIGRLVPHKRIHHIIRALALIDDAPILKIIGYGKSYKKLIELANSLKVKIDFVGAGQDGDKAIEMQKSLFLVTPCASLPLGEAALFKKATLMYGVETMLQKHGNIGCYVTENNIGQLARVIEKWVNNPEIPKRVGERAYDVIMRGETGLHTTKNAAKKMENIFEEALK